MPVMSGQPERKAWKEGGKNWESSQVRLPETGGPSSSLHGGARDPRDKRGTFEGSDESAKLTLRIRSISSKKAHHAEKNLTIGRAFPEESRREKGRGAQPAPLQRARTRERKLEGRRQKRGGDVKGKGPSGEAQASPRGRGMSKRGKEEKRESREDFIKRGGSVPAAETVRLEQGGKPQTDRPVIRPTCRPMTSASGRAQNLRRGKKKRKTGKRSIGVWW